MESSITMMIRSRAPQKDSHGIYNVLFFTCRGGNENDFQLISCSTCLVFLPIYTQIHRTVWINRFIFMTRIFLILMGLQKIDDGVKIFIPHENGNFHQEKKLIQNFSWFWILIRFSKVQLLFVCNYNHEDQRNHNSINKLNYIKTPLSILYNIG